MYILARFMTGLYGCSKVCRLPLSELEDVLLFFHRIWEPHGTIRPRPKMTAWGWPTDQWQTPTRGRRPRVGVCQWSVGNPKAFILGRGLIVPLVLKRGEREKPYFRGIRWWKSILPSWRGQKYCLVWSKCGLWMVIIWSIYTGKLVSFCPIGNVIFKHVKKSTVPGNAILH